MCVNDLVVQGAEPLFFLDYFATGRLQPAVAADVLEGVAEGCRQAGCALIGGETAEMPGLYGVGHYDLAGFAVGAVERDAALRGGTAGPGDVLLGLASSGLHANGFSLVRRVLERTGAGLDRPAPFDPTRSLGEALMTPSRIYVRPVLDGLRAGGIRALVHVTGGGLVENLPRGLAPSATAEIEMSAWQPPALFGWLAEAGDIAPAEMARTFNGGIGMVAAVAADRAEVLAEVLDAVPVGRVVARDGDGAAVRLRGLGATWPR